MISLLFKFLYAGDLMIEAGIVMRIILDLVKANSTNIYVKWTHDMSSIFINPFKGIVADSIKIDNFTISLTPIVALVFYIIIAFILSELIKAFSHQRLD